MTVKSKDGKPQSIFHLSARLHLTATSHTEFQCIESWRSRESKPTAEMEKKNNSANKLLVIIHRKAFQRFTQTVLAWMTSKIHIYTFSTTFSSISMFPSFLSHLQRPTQPLNNLNVFPSSPSALSHRLFFSTCSPPPVSPLIFSSLFQCTAPPTITSWLYFTSQTRPSTPRLAQSSHTARLLSTASSRAGGQSLVCCTQQIQFWETCTCEPKRISKNWKSCISYKMKKQTNPEPKSSCKM